MLKVHAPAKINLSLDVLGTLPDGFHEIRSVMQTLELHDTLELWEESSGINLSADSDAIPLGPENLVYRAARLLTKHTKLERGVHIHIKKRIPVAAGLGGGSSDAAATLMALNGFWELGLSPVALAELGFKIGADVPFFLGSKTALVSGKGEKITPLPAAPPMGVILVKPAFGVSTARVYQLFDTLEGKKSYSTDDMLAALGENDPGAIAACIGNNLEPVTTSLHPEIREIKASLLRAGAIGAQMSGSGPTVFGLADTPGQARALARRVDHGHCMVLPTSFAG